MNDASKEFNTQLELDVLLNGLTKLTKDYVRQFDVHNLTDVVIPEGVTWIGYSAFEGFNLTNITIPDTVTSIGEWAFSFCEGLTNITIPKSVTRIGNSVFRYCRSLASVAIGNREATIGVSAFANCPNLTNITVEGKMLDEVTLRRLIQDVYIRKKLMCTSS